MTLTTILAAGVATLAIATAATFLLPRHVTVERSALIDAAPDAVIALASTSEGFQRFNPYLTTDPELTIEPFGPAGGVGAGFRFDGRDGTGTQTISAVTPNVVTYAIDLGAMGQPVQHIRAEAEGDRTRVTWAVESDLGLNPIARVFGLFLDRMLGGTYETGLANIARVTA
ncbi:SRPBCC family protein [Hasllibacter sp. MH4015]|uniref:SRPBCC family protein n=1 Tax=Hasllibacter sp. MH4015 TaxID=2854029 RepID=UPI001CD638F7|nr:SRPBCC family protein [Hasllibacter sp. MH4015]